MYRCLEHILQGNKDLGFTSAHARFYSKVTFESFTGKAVTKLFVLRMLDFCVPIGMLLGQHFQKTSSGFLL